VEFILVLQLRINPINIIIAVFDSMMVEKLNRPCSSI
jgi:hypothetical protein